MSDEKWGPGDRKAWRFWGETQVLDDGSKMRLFFGEHPHGRQDKTIYAEFGAPGDGEFVAFDGHRVRIRLDIEEFNYMKSSGLSGSEVRKGCRMHIWMNDRLVYGRPFRQAHQAALWVRGQPLQAHGASRSALEGRRQRNPLKMREPNGTRNPGVLREPNMRRNDAQAVYASRTHSEARDR